MLRAIKGRFRSKATESGLSGWSTAPIGVLLVICPSNAGGRVLAFGQAVNSIVEEHQIEIEHCVAGDDEVIATDAQRITNHQ